MNTLIIRHLPESDPPRFQVEREDYKAATPVAVQPPFGFPVEGRPNNDLMQELRWYLEDFLEYPFSPETEHAERVLAALESWGKEGFNALFSSGFGRDWFTAATKDGHQHLCLQISSDDPAILQWPWESLLDPQATYLAVDCRIERRLNTVLDAPPISAELPTDRINILLVTARPYENDVGYRSISRRLVELIREKNILAHVHVLRPPTFANLREHLKEHSRFYHLIHFDGHGGFAEKAPTGSTSWAFSGKPEGVLVFENEKGEPDGISAEKLSGLLRDHAVPIMVLNACRSAMQSGQADDPFASVAAALVKAGVRGVVAMAYTLYVSGAQEFLPAFYRELFASGDLSQATRSGRQGMFQQRKRVCARGKYDLHDFVVPVLYQQERFDLSFIGAGSGGGAVDRAALPKGAEDAENPYGFIGRDRELLKLERAMRKEAPAILIHGLGGVGKSTLARGCVGWLADTGGMDGCLWLNFYDIRTAEFALNYLGNAIYGADFLLGDTKQKLDALAEALNNNQVVVVWDNFENVAGIPGTYVTPNLSAEDREVLRTLLMRIRKGKSKVLITSRSEEDWLGVQRLKVSIGGLMGEERWEYCEKILDNLGIKTDRADPGQVELMDLLEGHPLAMRVILPKMEKMTAGQIIAALKSNIEALGLEQETLYAALLFTEQKLTGDLKPFLVPLAFHERYVDSDYLEHMAKQVDNGHSRDKIDRFCAALCAAGLLREVGQGVFELHPALTGFLRSTLLKTVAAEERDGWSRAFVDVMGRLADDLAQRPLHEQRVPFLVHGANFHFALEEAERLGMAMPERAFTQSLAAYAQNTRNFDEAQRLYGRLAELRRKAGDKGGEAAAYHHLGIIAQERRDFAGAEKWYMKTVALFEKLGIEHHAAASYHQLGIIAQKRWDLRGAETWFLKSLAIKEKAGNERGTALTYCGLGSLAIEHRNFATAEKWLLKAVALFEKLRDEGNAAGAFRQLGMIAQKRRDFAGAEKWYLKSLAIEEKLGNEHCAALTYGQLGNLALEGGDLASAEIRLLKAAGIFEKLMDESNAAAAHHQLGIIAQERRDFAGAEKWYLKSLAIKEKLGDDHDAAIAYHQLGMIAQKRQDFAGAEQWYLKSLAINEKQGNEHGTALTYGQLGILAALRQLFEDATTWFAKSIATFTRYNDPHEAEKHVGNFLVFYQQAPAAQKKKMATIWEKAGLGPLPKEPKSKPKKTKKR